MDNFVEKSFEFPLLKEELSNAFSLFFGSFVCLDTQTEEGKKTTLSDTMIGTFHIMRQSLRGFRVPLDFLNSEGHPNMSVNF